MDDDQFTRLFSYMTERFDSIDQKLDRKTDKADVERLINTMDDFIRRILIMRRNKPPVMHNLLAW